MTNPGIDNPFGDAQQAADLRQQISGFAETAVKYGHVDRDWVNSQLNQLGAPLVTGATEYQINIPITGVYGATVWAENRTGALARFQELTEKALVLGRFTSRSPGAIYNLAATGDEPVFFSGPQDLTPDENAEPLTLDALKDGIRNVLKQGVSEKGWGIEYAVLALEKMSLPPLPPLHNKTVQVPVSGVTTLTVQVFDGEDDDAVQRAVNATMGRASTVQVKADEVGAAFMPRPDHHTGNGFTLVDEDDDED